MAHSENLWDSPVHCPDHQEFLSQLHLQRGKQQPEFPSQDRRMSEVCHVAVLFGMVIDWVVRCTTEDKPRGIRWTLFHMLEDFDFADDLALLSHMHQHMQEKTRHLSKFGQHVRLQISKRKTEVMTLNVNASIPVVLDDQTLPSTETFTYLGNVVRQDGGTNEDIQSRLSKVRNTFRMSEHSLAVITVQQQD